MNNQALTDLMSTASIVHAEMHSWTGSVRIRPEDFPPEVIAALPPKTLASLGSKNLVDDKVLKDFRAMNSELNALLRRYGISFLGASLVPDTDMPALTEELNKIKAVYDAKVDELFDNYAAWCDEWVQKQPDQWRDMIRRAQPDIAKLRRKFGFDWQVYKIDVQASGSDTPYGAGLATACMDSIERGVYEDLARRVADQWRRVNGKGSFAGMRTKVLQTTLDKAESCAAFAPSLRPFCTLMKAAVANATQKHPSPEAEAIFRAVMSTFSSADDLAEWCKRMASAADVDLDAEFRPAPEASGTEFIADEEADAPAPAVNLPAETASLNGEGFIPDQPEITTELLEEAEKASVMSDLTLLGFIPEED